MEKIYYTLDEAKNQLPEVAKRLKSIIRLRNAVNLIDSISIESQDYNMQYDLISLELYKKYHRMMYRLFTALQDLTSMGVIIKDLDKGLIDFYSTFEGREIFLCWQFGEKTITHWHEVESGFDGRKSVSLLEKKRMQK